jgi:hypothetical protein
MGLGNLIVVDCEAWGGAPCVGKLTEFGAVHYETGQWFHGKIWEHRVNPDNPAQSLQPLNMVALPEAVFADFRQWLTRLPDKNRPVFVSDNPAYDWQWINDGFWQTQGMNPFGHSARRIGDFYAGLMGSFSSTQTWKNLRVTTHDHNPVHDAQGNVEALRRLLAGERP